MRSSLGKTLVGTAVALSVSLGAVAATGVVAPPGQSASITTVAAVTVTAPASHYVTETLASDVGPRPEIQITTPVYVVAAGDTLIAIASRECASAADWPSLYVRNQVLIGANFNVLRVGWNLTIACDPSVPAPTPPPAPAPAPKPKRVVTVHVQTAAVTRRHTTAPASRVSTAGDGSFEACVIRRESGGNPNVMNGSGHYGLYQFSRSTWIAYGGSAADFGHASTAEQEAVFANAMARGGESNWAPYDGC